LFYVAVTRAERKLYLSFATSRFKYGSLIPCEPSRFIDEIDAKYLDMSLASMKNKAVYQRNSDEEQFVSANKPTSNKSIFTTPKAAAPLPPEDPNFVAGDISHLKAGDMVQHQRFGRGVVAEIEGEGQNQKAKVNFDNIGTKVLVLKFAKMRIL
jgi:DNA helicase-2/ATP-dependent DNA helicase PcrA